MKKRKSLMLATLVVALVVTMGLVCKGNSVKASANEEFISYKITVPSNYYSSKYISEMVLHYGVNGWNDTKDVKMYITTGPYKYGIPTRLEYNAVIKVRKGDTIDYCYKITDTDSITKWNNNDGKDYHVVANESNVKTIRYEVNWLADSKDYNVNGDVTLHYGVNGWDNARDVKMEVKSQYDYDGKTQTWYKAIIEVEEGSTVDY